MGIRLTIVVLLGAALVVTSGATAVEKPTGRVPAVCPVMGGPIDKSLSADYHGGKLYFCCGGCVQKFKADTAKYATKANYQLAVTGQAKQVACPLTGRKTNPQKVLKVGGLDVAFCCDGCMARVAKADAKGQLDLVFGKGFDKGYTVEKENRKD